jgi:dethiobiotin synthetase
MKGYFITGTDTGVGKTAVTAALCHLLRGRGTDAVPVKPVQTGVAPGESGDLQHCLAAVGLRPDEVELALMNPCRFRLPASPHLAAEAEGTVVDPDHLIRCCAELSGKHELLLVEGAGGLLVPLTRTVSTLDFAVLLGLPLIVVARSGLGTLNHSLLTLHAAREAGLYVAALILNRTGPQSESEDDRLIEADNVRVIAESGGVKVIGPLPHVPGAGENLTATRELASQLVNMLESDSISL